MVKRIINEMKFDAGFIKDHTLQPGWYKVLKVFILLGALASYYYIFGGKKLLIFCLVFFTGALMIHMLYRTMTVRYTRSWLDFKVVEKQGQFEYQRIGVFYYLMVAGSLLLAVTASLILG